MKYIENLQSVADLQPDYLGFIFYDRSPRNFEGIIPELPKKIKKTGVFVNEIPEILISLAQEYKLEALQLHGDETVDYIQVLKEHLKKVEIIKVFGIKDDFDFSLLEPYKDVVDYFLFDTKGKERGGNGVKFDWSVLKEYPLQKPFFLSGGIGVEDVEEVKKIKNSGLPVYAIDINSRFETKPGFKNIKLIKKFKQSVITSI
ncbi:phosphoribosylanthranilate isomerase [Pseudotenacibaculum haliotis]|uniref:N-(5'-phosphoribosyl)anthranilate isomerase n=1 Tax=Pseudotenacibaculum haliotis TaxID=1862138 RepID=A0ABW5LRD9_9FLAO